MKHKHKDTEKYLFLLQRSQLSVFRKSTAKIGTWKFNQKLVDQLEIKDIEAFTKTLETFLKQLKLEPGEVTLLLDSSIYFTHELKENQEEKKKDAGSKDEDKDQQDDVEAAASKVKQKEVENDERRKFVQSVPFSNTYSNIITLNKKRVVIVTNRDFYEPIIKKLAKLEYKVTHIFPLAIVADIFKSHGLTADSAVLLLNSVDKFKSNNLLEAPVLPSPGENEEDEIMMAPAHTGPITTEVPEEKGRLYLMIGAFVALLIILGGVIWWSGKRDQQLAAPSPVPVEPVEQTQVIPPEPANKEELPNTAVDLTTFLSSTPSAEAQYNQLSVEIENGTGDARSANEVAVALESAGFTSVVVAEADAVTVGSTIIRVTERVPVILQELLIDELLQLGYQSKMQPVDESDIDISIVLTSN